MRAGITDPEGPRLWRILPYFGAVAAFAFATFGPLERRSSIALGFGTAIAFCLLGVFSLRQKSPRSAELKCGPGYVDVNRAGTRNQRIHAKRIVGATTGRTADGLLLSLHHTMRDQPLTLKVTSDSDAERIRQSLGIGHRGFGTIAWRTADSMGKKGVVARAVVAVILFLVLLVYLVFGGEAVAMAGAILGPWAFLGAIFGLSAFLHKTATTVVMTVEGLRLLTAQSSRSLLYDSVLDVYNNERSLDFRVSPPYDLVSVAASSALMSVHERDILIAQVTAASQRARGLGPRKDDVAARLDALRRHGQTVGDWLVRLDMQGQMLSPEAGYRGNNRDTEDFWAILEDPEADPELRAAAARILKHLPRELSRVRIDAAVAAVRDDATKKRLRVAVDADLDMAIREITSLDATEPLFRPSTIVERTADERAAARCAALEDLRKPDEPEVCAR